jgi:hypothetical protein
MAAGNPEGNLDGCAPNSLPHVAIKHGTTLPCGLPFEMEDHSGV